MGVATYLPMDEEEGKKYQRRRHLRHLAGLKWPLFASTAVVLLLLAWWFQQAAVGPMQLQFATLLRNQTHSTPDFPATSPNSSCSCKCSPQERMEPDHWGPEQSQMSNRQPHNDRSSDLGSSAPSSQQQQQQQQFLLLQEQHHEQQLRQQQLLQQQLREQEGLLQHLREQNALLQQQQRDEEQQRWQQYNQQMELEASIEATSPLEMTTDAPMAVLPPFEPTCIFRDHSQMDDIQCPIMQCSKHPSCTIRDPKCCAYFNYQMLIFVADFLESKCMQDQYFVLYGTALGAFRNHTILPHTEDVDLGVTPLALQYLQLNATRRELWKHGYAAFHYISEGHPRNAFFKMCPHRHHPSPQFQAAMLKDHPVWTPKLKAQLPVYVDMWPIWPVDNDVQDCKVRNDIDIDAVLWTPWDTQFRSGVDPRPDYCRYRELAEQRNQEARQAAPGRLRTIAVAAEPDSRHWCVLFGAKPFMTRPGPGSARIGEFWFPSAADPDEHLSNAYGRSWRSPKPSNHGVWPPTPDGSDLTVAFAEKLSMTAWGDIPYPERWDRCEALVEQKAEAAGEL